MVSGEYAEEAEDCSICLEPIASDARRTLRCSHSFCNTVCNRNVSAMRLSCDVDLLERILKERVREIGGRRVTSPRSPRDVTT